MFTDLYDKKESVGVPVKFVIIGFQNIVFQKLY